MSSSSSDARLRTRNESRETRVDRIEIMHPDGMAAVLEIPQSFSTVHSFAQGQPPDNPRFCDGLAFLTIRLLSDLVVSTHRLDPEESVNCFYVRYRASPVNNAEGSCDLAHSSCASDDLIIIDGFAGGLTRLSLLALWRMAKVVAH